MSAQELVAAAMKATGASTPTELAKALRVEGYSAPQRVRRWMEGVNEPDFAGTLLLLEAIGMTIPTDAAPRPEIEPDLRDVLTEIRALDRKLDAGSLPETVRRLEELAQRLEDVVPR